MTLSEAASGFGPHLPAEVERLLDAGEFSGALALLKRWGPENLDQRVEFEILSGRAAMYLGKFLEARANFLRALWLGRKLPHYRIRCRMFLCSLLLNAGDLSRAQRENRRALAEIRLRQQELDLEPRLLGYLASIYRRRGMLSFSIRTHEEAVRLAQERGVERWGLMAVNLANALYVHGELDRMEALLQEVLDRPGVLSPSHVLYARVLVALHAMEVQDLDRADRVLAPVLEQVDRLEAALRTTALVCATTVLLRRGKAQEALTSILDLSGQVENEPALALMASNVVALQAEALLVLGRHEEALTLAQQAIRLGRASDPSDWANAMKIAAQCLAALGRRDAARTTIAEAHAILQASEYVLEQRSLDRVARSLGIALDPVAPLPGGRADGLSDAEPNWLSLRDGRAFLTVDPKLLSRIRQCAADDIPVLMEGETGTGKELVAHLIHELGPRSDGPLIVVDCAMLSEGLAEAELFGVMRGAYTGAVANRAGLVETADGGTLFLDELTELSLILQGKLLRLLQEGTFRRLGESRVRKVRTRVVAATNRDVEQQLRMGKIKVDLFYRLNGHRLRLPPLRERPRELRLLAEEFARTAGLLGLSSDAQRRLASYSWPGNVRELQMLVRVAASSVAPGGWLDESDLADLPSGFAEGKKVPSFRGERAEAERRVLGRALERTDGNIAAAARLLGISRQAFYKAMRRAGISGSDDVNFG